VVKEQAPSEYDTLDRLVRETCAEYSLKLEVSGWTRKTYDVFVETSRLERARHVARVESLSTSNGEIRFYDDCARAFCARLGEQLESAFPIGEAVLIREEAPGYS
jgi:hypothetical protein